MNILLVQTSFLGDTILSTPVITALKLKHPNSKIFMMTTPLAKELVRRDPDLSGVITFDKRGSERGLKGIRRKARELSEMNFSRVYSLHRSARTAVTLALSGIPERVGFREASLSFLFTEKRTRTGRGHEVLRNLSILDDDPNSYANSCPIRIVPPTFAELSDSAKALSKSLDKYAVIFPGSEWKTKMWKSEGYREVLLNLERKGWSTLLLGSPKERAICEAVRGGSKAQNRAGDFSLSESLYFVSRAGLVVCNDSMALHLASAFKVPCVSVFCATSPEFGFGPWQNRAKVVEKTGLSCKPCRRHGSPSCPNGTERCMRDLSSTEVISAIGEVI